MTITTKKARWNPPPRKDTVKTRHEFSFRPVEKIDCPRCSKRVFPWEPHWNDSAPCRVSRLQNHPHR